MTRDTNDQDSEETVQADGGVAAEKDVDYLETEINLLKPSTPYMRDHLKIVWGTFIAWVLIVWGPVTLTVLAPDAMTTTMPVIEFPLHYFLVAFGAPTGALILAAVYARQRDKLDEKYGIEHSVVEEQPGAEETAAADGGVEQ